LGLRFVDTAGDTRNADLEAQNPKFEVRREKHQHRGNQKGGRRLSCKR
jgi:hypothetical protein